MTIKRITLMFLFFCCGAASIADPGNPIGELKDTKTVQRLDEKFGNKKKAFSVKITVEGKVEKKRGRRSAWLEGKNYELFVKLNNKKSLNIAVTPDSEFKHDFYIDSITIEKNGPVEFQLLHDDIINKPIFENRFLFDSKQFDFKTDMLEVKIEFFYLG